MPTVPPTTMKPLLIVKLGEAPEAIVARRADFEHWIEAALASSLPVRVVDPRAGEPLPEAETLAGAVLTGSAAMVTERLAWSETTAEWLRGLVARAVPVLGICYGHQLLAHAHGGRVDYHGRGLEAGTVALELTAAAGADPLLAGLPGRFPAQAMHRQAVLELPPAALCLAASGAHPHYAYRIGESAWGVQFHPEFDEEVVAGYLRERGQQIQAEGGDPDALRAGLRPTPLAAGLLRRFAALVEARVEAASW